MDFIFSESLEEVKDKGGAGGGGMGADAGEVKEGEKPLAKAEAGLVLWEKPLLSPVTGYVFLSGGPLRDKPGPEPSLTLLLAGDWGIKDNEDDV